VNPERFATGAQLPELGHTGDDVFVDTAVEASEFLLDSNYVVFAEVVYRQRQVIPMGTHPAPRLANLFL
jgi:hypothetical protein